MWLPCCRLAARLRGCSQKRLRLLGTRQQSYLALRSCVSAFGSRTAQRRHSCPEVMSKRNETAERRAERKAEKKAAKAARRAQREGNATAGDPDFGRKPCDLCKEMKDLLIRCQVDESQRWHMVCGKCWKGVSGGVVDGDAGHPHYRYGGLWKNLHKRS